MYQETWKGFTFMCSHNVLRHKGMSQKVLLQKKSRASAEFWFKKGRVKRKLREVLQIWELFDQCILIFIKDAILASTLLSP